MIDRRVAPIPVHILTGFLGAGKTTLLNRLMRAPGLGDTAVIVNEFGEIGLDHLLIGSARDTVMLLDSGCLCCALEGTLRDTLAQLFARRASGEIPWFTRVLIETSGLAEPAPMLETLLADPVLAGFYAMGSLVCLIDAGHGLATLDTSATARAQAALADRIVITKVDIVGEAPAALVARLAALNPDAELLVATAALDPAALLRDRGWQPRPTDGHTHHHDHEIVTHAFRLDRAVVWAGVAAWTGHLAARWGDALLRTKALIELRGEPRPLLVQGVRSRFELRRLDAWPDETRGARIVLIGEHIDRDSAVRGLDWLDAPSGEAQPASAQFPTWSKLSGALPT